AQAPTAMLPPQAAASVPARPQATARPMANGTQARAPAFVDDRDTPIGDRRTVLVVEDDEPFARILFDLAHELGYRCLVAHNAGDGVALAMEQVPDAVLLDMRLPDGTGLSVLQQLKEDP